jgi:hypothetical protein
VSPSLARPCALALVAASLCLAPVPLPAQTDAYTNPQVSNGVMTTDAVLAASLPERPTTPTTTSAAPTAAQPRPQVPIWMLAAWVATGTLLALIYLLRTASARALYRSYAEDHADPNRESA